MASFPLPLRTPPSIGSTTCPIRTEFKTLLRVLRRLVHASGGRARRRRAAGAVLRRNPRRRGSEHGDDGIDRAWQMMPADRARSDPRRLEPGSEVSSGRQQHVIPKRTGAFDDRSPPRIVGSRPPHTRNRRRLAITHRLLRPSAALRDFDSGAAGGVTAVGPGGDHVRFTNARLAFGRERPASALGTSPVGCRWRP